MSDILQKVRPPPPKWRTNITQRKAIAVIGTGGSIATLGRSPLDLVDYGEFGKLVAAEDLLRLFPDLADLANLQFTEFETVHSEAMDLSHWRQLSTAVSRLTSSGTVDGVVVVHGTSTLEEGAWFLHLTTACPIPVVFVGAMRPANGLSSDAGFNLASAICAACHSELADTGVVAVLGGEIHTARDVTKESTYRLNSFGSGELGPLGYVDASGQVILYRKSCRGVTTFDLQKIKSFARVDVVFSYAGADGEATAAFLKAGASGLVVASMAPGTCGPLQVAALEAAAGQGVTIAFSSRSGQGRVLDSEFLRRRGFLAADNLSPQKARILLALALSSGYSRDQLQSLFDRS